MEKYTKAELEVIKITSEDIVTESSDIDFCPGDNSDTPIVPIPWFFKTNSIIWQICWNKSCITVGSLGSYTAFKGI